MSNGGEKTTSAGGAPKPAGWRFKVGIALFALMILAWLLIPIEAALGMSAGAIAATTAGIAIGNKIILLVAIAVMGKAGFQELKAKVFHKLTPPAEVSPMRYRIGLVLFCLPLLQGLQFELAGGRPELPEVSYLTGEAFFQTGSFVEAATQFRNLADHFPESPYAPLALLHPRIGRAWCALAWGFHVGVLATMAIAFVYPLSFVAFACFFDVEELAARVLARVHRAQPAIAP